MRSVLFIIAISLMLLSCASQKDVCPGEIVARDRGRYTPVKASSERAIKNMAKPSMIQTSKVKGRKPPKASIYTAKSNAGRKPPK